MKRIREALAISVAMGANTIRILSCGISVGTPTSIENARSNYGKAGLAQVRQTLRLASERRLNQLAGSGTLTITLFMLPVNTGYASSWLVSFLKSRHHHLTSENIPADVDQRLREQ